MNRWIGACFGVTEQPTPGSRRLRPTSLSATAALVMLMLGSVAMEIRSQSLPDAPGALRQQSTSQPGTGTNRSAQHVDGTWPREIDHGQERISVYQPQVDSWDGDEIHAYAALSVEAKASKKPRYGVVWFTARTEVDKVNRQVTLDNFQTTKVKFPAMESRETEFQTFLEARLPGKSRVIALDRLQAELALVESEKKPEIKGLPVKNDPPRIIFTTKPSLLVLVDGPPQLRDVGGTKLQRVLNTQATILLDPQKPKYYLQIMDGWLEAPELTGPWSYAKKIPDDMKDMTKNIREQQKEKATEGGPPPSLEQANEKASIPAIYMSLGPAELLVCEGPPQFEPLPATKLEYVKNTTANIFRDTGSLDYFVVLAGRWFRSSRSRMARGSLLMHIIYPMGSQRFRKTAQKLEYWHPFQGPRQLRKPLLRIPFLKPRLSLEAKHNFRFAMTAIRSSRTLKVLTCNMRLIQRRRSSGWKIRIFTLLRMPFGSSGHRRLVRGQSRPRCRRRSIRFHLVPRSTM